MNIIVWFRKDLRVSDNPAFQYAIKLGKILPVYIYDDTKQVREIGGASKWWLYNSLISLNKSLDDNLVKLIGSPEKIITNLIKKFNIDMVVWNRCYEPYSIKRDIKIKESLTSIGTKVKSFNGSLLWEPWSVLKKDGTAYRVFSPFNKNCCTKMEVPRKPEINQLELNFLQTNNNFSHDLNSKLLGNIDWHSKMHNHWIPGEKEALKKLDFFCENHLHSYAIDRDFPSFDKTSRLSPHLHFGEVSPNTVWYKVKSCHQEKTNSNIDSFLSEIVWREFAYYLIYHFPDFPDENYQSKFNKLPWKYNECELKIWRKGLTGIPIIDAGMNELWQTGYMHNRVRMIVASFLTKNLMHHWKDGEEWFWDCLLDAELGSNVFGWQWSAGTGIDAAPFFRVMNPVRQGEKFDGEGKYVKKYCPILGKMPSKYIHKPWEADENLLKYAGVELGINYPKPICNLKESRDKALKAFGEIK